MNGKKKKEPKLPERKKGFNNFQGRDYTRDDYIGLIEK